MKTYVGSSYKRRWMACLIVLSLSLTSAGQAASIHEIAKSGDLAQLQRVTLDGTDVNERSTRGETPLMIATIAGHGEIVSYLLQRGADINARNDSGLAALHAAAYVGQTDIARLLIKKGADINDGKNDFGVTPLHLAAEENHVDTVRLLLEYGADTTLLEINGYSPLSRAGWRAHWDVVAVLIAGGATCQPEAKVGEWLYQECTARVNP